MGTAVLGRGWAEHYFLSCNRGKRSLALDLKNPAAHDVVDDLIRAADVLVENFLPDALASYGLTPNRLQSLNPRLISCSISGFGRTGPQAGVAGYDLVTQAGTGLVSITGEPDGPPLKVGVAISDILTGLYAAISALAGLYARGPNGAGRAFDLALADCTLASLVNVAQSALVTGERPKRWGNAHPQIVPYEAFETADGFLVIGVGNDDQWRKFCAAVDEGAWAVDPRFTTNAQRVEHREELLALFAPWCGNGRAIIGKSCCPRSACRMGRCTRSMKLWRGRRRPREMILPVVDHQGRSYSLLASPIHYQDEPRRQAVAPPDLGQHTDEVLREWLSLDRARIAVLRQSGAIA